MQRILILTVLLILGLLSSQLVPAFIGEWPTWFYPLRQLLTMSFLAFIMIEVGREFEVDFSKKKEFAIDYAVAATAAAFPWIFCAIYFLLFLMPEVSSTGKPQWIEALLAARFAAPTSAGVLFSMLAAAGLAGTWAFNKTRILAIFDDLDTVLFMIPLKILMVGLAWQLGVVVFVIVLIVVFGWKFFRQLNLPSTWPWILAYSFLIAGISEGVYALSKDPVTLVGVHIEVLLPAFILGCMLRVHPEESPILDHQQVTARDHEALAGFMVSAAFMFLVGLSMPAAFGENPAVRIDMSAGEVILHVIAVTFISNLGKMFVCFCYRTQASFKQRLAVAVAMFPRGEVGAGVLTISLAYGIQGPFVTIGFLSLALNLILTGVFILIVKQLLKWDSFRTIQG